MTLLLKGMKNTSCPVMACATRMAVARALNVAGDSVADVVQLSQAVSRQLQSYNTNPPADSFCPNVRCFVAHIALLQHYHIATHPLLPVPDFLTNLMAPLF